MGLKRKAKFQERVEDVHVMSNLTECVVGTSMLHLSVACPSSNVVQRLRDTLLAATTMSTSQRSDERFIDMLVQCMGTRPRQSQSKLLMRALDLTRDARGLEALCYNHRYLLVAWIVAQVMACPDLHTQILRLPMRMVWVYMYARFKDFRPRLRAVIPCDMTRARVVQLAKAEHSVA